MWTFLTSGFSFSWTFLAFAIHQGWLLCKSWGTSPAPGSSPLEWISLVLGMVLISFQEVCFRFRSFHWPHLQLKGRSPGQSIIPGWEGKASKLIVTLHVFLTPLSWEMRWGGWNLSFSGSFRSHCPGEKRTTAYLSQHTHPHLYSIH